MVSTQSKASNKYRKVVDVWIIPYNATCITLNICYKLYCHICKIKREQQMGITKEGWKQQSNFRLKDRWNKYEQ